MKKTLLLMIILSVFTKATGLLRDVTLSYLFGTTGLSDAYFISMSIPLVLYSIVGVAIKTAYIPIATKIRNEESEKASIQFTNSFLNILIVFSSLLYLLILFNTEFLVSIFAVGFSQEVFQMAVTLTRISSLSIIPLTVVYIYEGFLNSKNSFLKAILATIPVNITTIFFYMLSSKTTYHFLALGSTVGTIIQMLILFYYARKIGYLYEFRIKMDKAYFKRTIFLIGPVVLGTGANQINNTVDKTIASTLVEGAISSINYANRISKLMDELFVVSISTIVFTRATELAAQQRIQELKETITSSIILTLYILLPSTSGLIFLSKNIVVLFYGRGAFGIDAVNLTSTALIFYSLGLVFLGARHILSRIFYALEDSISVVKNTIISVIINITFSLILVKDYGVAGLAFATSFSNAISTLLLFTKIRQKIGEIGVLKRTEDIFKIIFSTLIMSVVVIFVVNNLDYNISYNLRTVISIICGVIVYLIVSIVLKIPEVMYLVNSIRSRTDKLKK